MLLGIGKGLRSLGMALRRRHLLATAWGQPSGPPPLFLPGGHYCTSQTIGTICTFLSPVATRPICLQLRHASRPPRHARQRWTINDELIRFLVEGRSRL